MREVAPRRVRAVARGDARARVRLATPTSGPGRWRTSARSGRRSGSTSTSSRRRRTRRRSPTRRCRARAGSPGHELSYAEHIFRGKDRRRASRSSTPRSCARSARRPGASCSGARRPSPPGSRELGVERGDRVAAYLPNIEEAVGRLPRHREHRRDLVVVLARLRRARASSTASRRSSRRCCSRSTATATAARTSTGATRSQRIRSDVPGARAHRAPAVPRRGAARRTRWRGPRSAAARRCRPAVRAAAVRPPAVGALLVGHDRAAEVDRARPGRRPARVPEGALPPLRPARGRPALLVHDDRAG